MDLEIQFNLINFLNLIYEGLSTSTFGFGASKVRKWYLAFGGPRSCKFDEKIPEDQQISRLYISNFQINGLNAAEVIKQKINF